MPKTTRKTPAAPARRKRRSREFLPPPQNDFRTISAFWKQQDVPTRAAWNLLGSRLTPPKSGRNTFLSVNLTRRSMDAPYVFTAPLVPETVPYLETPTLSAVSTTPQPGGTLRVTLHNPGGACPTPVQVYFAAPRVPSPGVVPPAEKHYLLATLPGLPHGDTDLTAVYLRRFLPPGTGSELWVRLLPLSPLGFRGQPVAARADAVME